MPTRAKQLHRLKDTIVEEVSLVDRPANKRPFLVIKRDNTMSNAAALTAASETLEKLPDLVRAANDESEGSAQSLVDSLRKAADQVEEGAGLKKAAKQDDAKAKADAEAKAKAEDEAKAAEAKTKAEAAAKAAGEVVKADSAVMAKLDQVLAQQGEIKATLGSQAERLTTVEKSWQDQNSGETNVTTDGDGASGGGESSVHWPADLNDQED